MNGPEWALALQEAGDKTKAIAASRSLIVGDMFDFDSSVSMAIKALEDSKAGQRHIIIISDGGFKRLHNGGKRRANLGARSEGHDHHIRRA